MTAVGPLSVGSIATSGIFTLDTADQLNSASASSATFVFSTFPAYGDKGEASTGTSSGFWINTSPKPFSEFSFNIFEANGASLADANIYTLVNGSIQRLTATTSNLGNAQLQGGSRIGSTVIISKPGYLPVTRVITEDQATDASLTASLTPLPDPPGQKVRGKGITESEKGAALSDAFPEFRIYEGGTWKTSSLATLDPTLPTIVMAHGWRSDLDAWPESMAGAISGTIHPQQVNIVGWSWQEKADTRLPPIAEAARQGTQFGRALYAHLGSDYSQHLHFIGHSLGTIVNAYACDSAHGNCGVLSECDWETDITTPHLTLLDEASLANTVEDRLFVSRNVVEVLKLKDGLNETLEDFGTITPHNDWIDPIPREYDFIDNYISSVGSYQEEAVNILITSSVDRIANRSIPSVAFPFGAPGSLGAKAVLVSEVTGVTQVALEHSHAPIFYQDHILASQTEDTSVFHWALESSGNMVTAGRPKGKGLFLYENLTTPGQDVTYQAPDYSWVSVIENQPPELGIPAAKLRSLGIAATSASLIRSGESLVTEIKQDIEISKDVAIETGRIIGDSTQAYITYANHKKDEAFETLGEVGYETAVTVGHAWESGTTKVSETVDWISEQPVVEKFLQVTSPTFNLTNTFTLFKRDNQRSPRGKSLTEDVGVWLTIEVPTNVDLLTFDMMRTGETGRDSFVCAINGQNKYRVPAAFIPETWSGAEFIDISEFRGQTIEVFFGFIGDTASASDLAVRGLRFVTFPQPEMQLTTVEGTVMLEMPQNLNGMKLEVSESLEGTDWTDLETSAIQRQDTTLRLFFGQDDFEKLFFRFAPIEEPSE